MYMYMYMYMYIYVYICICICMCIYIYIYIYICICIYMYMCGNTALTYWATQNYRKGNSFTTTALIMTPLINHLTISKIFIILYLTLTVSFAHSTFCVLVFYFYFFGIAATWQPSTTCLHIPLLYIPAYLNI